MSSSAYWKFACAGQLYGWVPMFWRPYDYQPFVDASLVLPAERELESPGLVLEMFI
jgi:hypothetical protein